MSPVTNLILATVAFVGSHFLMSHPLREAMVVRFGPGGFMGVYSLVSAITFGWMVWAAWVMPPMIPHWTAPLWVWQWLAPALMLLASILLVGANLKNPAMPQPAGGDPAVRPAIGVFAITRHPMNWAFIIWALTHIALLGSPRNLILGVGILVLTVGGSFLQDSKKRGLLGDGWRGWEARTSFVPFGAVIDGRIPLRAVWPGAVPLIGGLLLWVAASWVHTMPVGLWS